MYNARWIALISIASCAAACAASNPEPLLAADASRDGASGRDGPRSVARLHWKANIRVTESVDITVTYPSTSAGLPDMAGAPYPLVVFVQGGLVAPERYQWLATHLGSRGMVTMTASHRSDLAILTPDNSALALDALLERARDPDDALAGLIADEPAPAYMGHSLGGVIATRQWLADAQAKTLVLLASYPADDQDVAARAGNSVLSISGNRDGSAVPDDVAAGLERFADPRMLAFVDGMNHYAWTDDPQPGELDGDNPTTRPTAELRRDAMNLIDTWLDAYLMDNADAQERLSAGQFAGIEVQVP